MIACPNDGEPLLSGPDGQNYCQFDGWRPPGAARIDSSIRQRRGMQ